MDAFPSQGYQVSSFGFAPSSGNQTEILFAPFTQKQRYNWKSAFDVLGIVWACL